VQSLSHRERLRQLELAQTAPRAGEHELNGGGGGRGGGTSGGRRGATLAQQPSVSVIALPGSC
jgi:hypothetical protein